MALYKLPTAKIINISEERVRYDIFLDSLDIDENYYRKCLGEIDVIMRDQDKAIIKAFDNNRYMVDNFTIGIDINAVKLGDIVIVDIDRKRHYVTCVHSITKPQ